MKEVRILGRIMTEDELNALHPDDLGHYKVVFSINWSSRNIMVKNLSELPYEISDNSSFICNLDRLDRQLGFLPDDDVYRRLENRFIIFTPKITENAAICFDPVYADIISENVLEYDNFVSIPVIDLDKLNINFEQFEERVKENKIFNCKMKISADENDLPSFILVKKKKLGSKNSDIFLYGEIKKISYEGIGIKIEIDEVEKNKVLFSMYEHGEYLVDDITDGIIFMPFFLENEYLNRLSEVQREADYREYEKLNNSEPAEIAEDEVIDFKNISIEDIPDEKVEMESEMVNNRQDTENSNILESLRKCAKNERLLYTDDDLLNFDISLRSSTMVILSGMSGTGKSKLVGLYAQAIDADKYYGFKFISVSPAWTDDSDILGYVDYKNMIYREADIGLVKFLLEAEQHPERKYIVCFDEMNLAKVERYFSQFISVLENDASERELIIYNKDIKDKLYNSNIYPPVVKLRQNIMFVGTVNIDDSTFNLSDKVLDRSSVIKLTMRPFTDMIDTLENCRMTYDELKLLDDLQNLIKINNPKLGIGYRIVNQMNNYLTIATQYKEYNRHEALDGLIVQRIIPKLRGSDDQLRSLIGTIENGQLQNSSIMDLLKKYEDVSSFKLVRQALECKAKELKAYGYTI